jgi:hypothetical protein
LLLAAVVTIGISSPVLAQSRHHGLNDYGLVNWQNVYDVVRKVRTLRPRSTLRRSLAVAASATTPTCRRLLIN